MRNKLKNVFSIVLSLVMVFSLLSFGPEDFQNVVQADDVTVTSFQYDFAYSTPGYADGTIYINANQDETGNVAVQVRIYINAVNTSVVFKAALIIGPVAAVKQQVQQIAAPIRRS